MTKIKDMLKEAGGYATELGRFDLDMLYVEFAPKGLIKYDPKYEYTRWLPAARILSKYAVSSILVERLYDSAPHSPPGTMAAVSAYIFWDATYETAIYVNRFFRVLGDYITNLGAPSPPTKPRARNPTLDREPATIGIDVPYGAVREVVNSIKGSTSEKIKPEPEDKKQEDEK